MAKQMSKSALKARMLQVFRDIEASGEPLVVTDRGRPVLRVVPIRHAETVREVFGHLHGQVHLPPDDVLTAPLPDDLFADSDLEELL